METLDRRNRLSLRLVLAGLVGGLLMLAVVGASPASAAETCVKPPPRDDDTIHVLGCLTDNRTVPRTPVAGVSITVEDAEGNVIGSDLSDETGIFDIALPGTSLDVLGQTFVIKIDSETLPEGTFLVDPEKVTITQRITTTTDQFILFPIGEDNRETTSTAVRALQLTIGGLVFSLVLAMAALGLSMIYGTTGLTNFAHGELVTFGALVAYGVDVLPGTIELGSWNVTVLLALLVAVAASVLFGWLQDATLWRPLRSRGTGVIAMMIVSIGLSILLRNVFQYFVGGEAKNYTQYTSQAPWDIGPINLTPLEVWIIGGSILVLVGASLVLQMTRIGKATRAVADNPALAASSGINVERVIRFVWMGGAGLAGLAGVLLGLSQSFDFQFGFKILLLIFAAVTLGGLGTIWGAMAGAMVIGIFVELSTLWVPAELKYVGALAILIIILLVRPQGLLGRAERVG